MLDCEHESIFPRLTTTRATSGRCRPDPSGDREDLRDLGSNHQAVSQTAPRERPCATQSDPWSARFDRSGAGCGPVAAIGSPSRCEPGRALSAVGSRAGPQGEHSQHQPCHDPPELDAQKKTLVAREQDEAARAAWREQASQLASQDLVFVDETGTHIALTPLYARAPRGQRAVGKVPRNTGANTTLLASLSLDGMGEALILEGAADGLAFEAYIEQLLAPSLRPGQIVVMDNLSIHQGERVRQAIQAKGCQFVFLPAYSPDFSPIEPAFSKLKAVLRRIGARTHEALFEAIAQALLTVTAADARGWFTHCGYPPPIQSEPPSGSETEERIAQ